MRNICYPFLLLIIMFFFFSCEEKIDEPFQKIQFNIDRPIKIKISELVDSIRFIKLKTPADLQISSISMVKSFNEYFVIKNAANPASLIIFNRDGKFVSEIKSYGKGPGEYSQISSFFIDGDKKHIELIDRLSQKKLIFDMHNKLIEENIDSKWGGNDIIMQNNNYIVHYGNSKHASNYMISIFDDNYKKIDSYLKIPDNYVNFFHISDNFNFSKYSNKTLFWYALSPYLYSIDQDGLHKKYMIDFGIHNIPSKVFNGHYDNVASFMQKIWAKDYACIIGAAGEGDRFLFVRASKGKDSFYHLFYDKKNRLAKVVNGYQDDILFDQDWGISISDISVVLYENNKLYFAIDAYQMSRIINHEFGDTKQKINSTELPSKSLGDVSPYDNPFLIELSLRK